MIGDKIEDDFKVARMRLADQSIEISQRAEQRMDRGIVRHIVAEVLHRRWVNRRDPNGIDAEPAQIIQSRDQAHEIAHAVAVAVHEGARINLVYNTALPPEICRSLFCHVRSLLGRLIRHRPPALRRNGALSLFLEIFPRSFAATDFWRADS